MTDTPQPQIYYGSLQQPLHPNAQYLLMQAEIGNGTYQTAEFMQKINAVSLDGITSSEGQRDVRNARTFMQSFSALGSTIKIEGFEPNREKLESFVNTTFAEMRTALQQK
ncbi:MAG: hypothetical protein HGA85_04930 [Nanoarchaeota archaeon]|nr:hypothetical protein [Nanoarchaeota archaeon]